MDPAEEPSSEKLIERAHARAGRGAAHAWKLSEQSVGAFFGHNGTQLAASISYYALFSIFPAAIAMAAIFGLVVKDAQARNDVIDFLLDALPLTEEGGRRDLDSLLDGVTRNSGALGVIGLVGILYSASALMSAVRNSLGAIWGEEHKRPPLTGKALDVLLILALGLLIALSLAAEIVRSFAVDLSGGLGFLGPALEAALDASGALIPFVLSLIAFAALYRIVPARVHSLRDVWPGVLLAAIGYELAKGGFALYLENFGNYSAVYGSLGAVIAFMVFVYIAAIVFLLGAEFAAHWPPVRAGAYDRPEGEEEEGAPLRERVLGFLRSLVVDVRKAEARPDERSPRATPESDASQDREAARERDTSRTGTNA